MTAQDLKNSILQQAIQGKLLPQNPADEPASELLKKISAERQKLIDEGKIKNPPQLPPILDDEKPFDIPENWTWARIRDIAEVITGSTPSKKQSDYYGGIFPFFKPADLNYSRHVFKASEYLSEKGKQVSKIIPINSIGVCCIGTIGKCGYFEVECTTNQQINSVVPKIYPLYVYYYFLSNEFINDLLNKSSATTISIVNKSKMESCKIPLPPLAEQKRIVEKLEEILPLIERYGELEQRLTKLDKEFPDKLKKSLLQQAIQGKLTRQLSTDGDAKDLLEKIREEKLKLVVEGKIKKEKPLPPISAEEIPFDIPENWKWVRLGEIVFDVCDGTHNKPEYKLTGIPFLSVKDISDGYLNFDGVKFISEDTHKDLKKRCFPQCNDLLITKVGSNTGIPVLVDTDKEFSLFVSVSLIKYPQTLLYPKYFLRLIQSPLVQKQVAENTKGIGHKNWVIRDIKNTLVILPTLADQKRIVERLEELLPLCDRLKEKFSEVQ